MMNTYFFDQSTGKDVIYHFCERKKIYFSQGSGSGVKHFLHRQSVLSATLFLAQAETAELTAVMSLALMECFVPQCVRMPPGFCASCESSVQEPRWLMVAPFFKCKKTPKNITIFLDQVDNGLKWSPLPYRGICSSVVPLCVNVMSQTLMPK